jgi:hypothetical protein
VGPLSPRHSASSGCGWREGLQIRRVAANILNKQSWTGNKGWSSSLGVGRGANKSRGKLEMAKCFVLLALPVASQWPRFID